LKTRTSSISYRESQDIHYVRASWAVGTADRKIGIELGLELGEGSFGERGGGEIKHTNGFSNQICSSYEGSWRTGGQQ
jgi:hypothetical protein